MMRDSYDGLAALALAAFAGGLLIGIVGAWWFV
jgi:hypothetical protein